MKNNKGILDCKNKTFTFAYLNEMFTIDLTEGDLEDSWNSILFLNGTMMDFNFYWEDYENTKPMVSLYDLKKDEDGELLTDTSKSYPIKVVEISGTKAQYFSKSFDNSLSFKFLLVSEGQILYQTKKVEKVAREFTKRIEKSSSPIKILLMDSNGATKEYRNVN